MDGRRYRWPQRWGMKQWLNCCRGYKAVVKLLLARDVAEAESKNKIGQPPLS
jgi:hypothetical protein